MLRASDVTAQGDESLSPVIEPCVEVAERLPHHAVRRRHAHTSIRARSFEPFREDLVDCHQLLLLATYCPQRYTSAVMYSWSPKYPPFALRWGVISATFPPSSAAFF